MIVVVLVVVVSVSEVVDSVDNSVDFDFDFDIVAGITTSPFPFLPSGDLSYVSVKICGVKSESRLSKVF